MRVVPATSFTDLAFHGLAHVPLRGPESLYDPRYVAWSRETLETEAREPLAHDAAAIGAQIDALGSGMAVQWLPLLHEDVESFVATGQHELAELDPSATCDPAALRCLRRADPIALEWLRADLLLAARAYAVAHEALASAIATSCEAIADVLATVRGIEVPSEVVVAWALGARGRGFPGRVIVGACAPWSDLDAATPAAIALHEHAVAGARGSHGEREWHALARIARALAEKGPERIRSAHARWLARLDLEVLTRDAEANGRVDRETAERLRAAPDERASLLAQRL